MGFGKMEIRKAKKEDLKDYLKLKKESLEDYSKLVNKEIKASVKKIKKEFNDFISSKNKFILIISDKEIIGYITSTLKKNIYQKYGYIDDIFIRKGFRKKGYAKLLLKELTKIMKSKGVKNIRLGVRKNNRKAVHFYKKNNFKMIHYEMEKKI